MAISDTQIIGQLLQ